MKVAKEKEFITLKILAGTLAIFAAFSVRNYIERCLWFDEALTITEFVASPASYLKVYTNYSIPNNHILYSIFMRLYLDILSGHIVFSNPILRFPSVILGIAFVIFCFNSWRKYISLFSLFFVLAIFAISPTFAIYASAVRGYILSMLLCAACLSAIFAVCENRKHSYPLYLLLCILAVGVMPNIALAIFAASLLPFAFAKSDLNRKNFCRLCFAPFICLLVFYLPILPQFLKVISIKEGWNSGFAASAVFYSSTIIILLPAVISALFGVLGKQKGSPICISFILIIFLLPLFFFILRKPAPFPRTFISLIPIWLFILAKGAEKAEQRLKSFFKTEKTANFAAAAIMFISLSYSLIIHLNSKNFSPIVEKYGQDDFFRPYFMDKNFNPDYIVSELIKLTQKRNGIIFADQSADFPSLVFSAKRFGMRDEFILHDSPKKNVETFPESGSDGFIVASSYESAAKIANRFGLKLVSEETEKNKQIVFRAKK